MLSLHEEINTNFIITNDIINIDINTILITCYYKQQLLEEQRLWQQPKKEQQLLKSPMQVRIFMQFFVETEEFYIFFLIMPLYLVW